MNNKKYIIYKSVLKALNNILSQNNIFNIKLKSIIRVEEKALINAINDIYTIAKRFNYFSKSPIIKILIIDKLR